MSKILIAMFAGTLNENGERVLPAFYEYVVSQLKKKNDVFFIYAWYVWGYRFW